MRRRGRRRRRRGRSSKGGECAADGGGASAAGRGDVKCSARRKWRPFLFFYRTPPACLAFDLLPPRSHSPMPPLFCSCPNLPHPTQARALARSRRPGRPGLGLGRAGIWCSVRGFKEGRGQHSTDSLSPCRPLHRASVNQLREESVPWEHQCNKLIS